MRLTAFRITAQPHTKGQKRPRQSYDLPGAALIGVELAEALEGLFVHRARDRYRFHSHYIITEPLGLVEVWAGVQFDKMLAHIDVAKGDTLDGPKSPAECQGEDS